MSAGARLIPNGIFISYGSLFAGYVATILQEHL